jgi:hypothetical protein
MASLATALSNTGVAFSDELTYVPGLAPRSSNCAFMEKGGMQVSIGVSCTYVHCTPPGSQDLLWTNSSMPIELTPAVAGLQIPGMIRR